MIDEFENHQPFVAGELVNPYKTPAEIDVAEVTSSDLVTAKKPRLWSVWVVFVCSFVLMIAMSVVAILVYILPAILQNPDAPPAPEDIVDQLSTPLGFIIQALPAQLALLVSVIAAAVLSPVEWKQRLGLRDSGLTMTEWIATGLGAFVPATIGLCLATALALVIEPDESVSKLYESMTVGIAAPFILFIAIAPGFAEEMMYRGYMQRRLLQRWSPAQAIFVSSLLFALVHIMPHAIVFAFPIGVWFGYVAWKTGSIWPTILGHALINGTWNILHVSQALVGYSDTVYNVLCGILIAIGMAGLAYCWPAIQRVAEPQRMVVDP